MKAKKITEGLGKSNWLDKWKLWHKHKVCGKSGDVRDETLGRKISPTYLKG